MEHEPTNEFRLELRNEMAYVALEVCKTEGDLIRYQDRAQDEPIKIWCIPGVEERKLSSSGPISEEQTTRTFTAPRQCGYSPEWVCEEDCKYFPPKNQPSTYAIIHYEGWDWSVDSWKADSVGAAFMMKTTRHQPRRIEDEE